MPSYVTPKKDTDFVFYAFVSMGRVRCKRIFVVPVTPINVCNIV